MGTSTDGPESGLLASSEKVRTRGSGFAFGVLTQVASNAVVPLSALLTLPLLAQALGVDGRGELAAGSAPFLLVSAILTLGLPEAVTNRVAKDPARARSYMRRAMLLLGPLGLFASLSTWLVLTYVLPNAGAVGNVLLICLLATSPSLIIAVIRGAASGLGLWRRVAFERIITAVSRLVILIVLWWAGFLNPLSAAFAVSWSPLLGALAYLGSWPQPTEASSEVRLGVMRYGLQVWIGTVGGILLSRLDQSLMLSFSSFEQLGLYAVAVSISEIPLVINSAVSAVVFAAGIHSGLDEKIQQAGRLSFLLCFLLGTAMLAPAPLWVPVLLGPEFNAAIPACCVLVIAVLLGLPGSIAGSSLSARGWPAIRSMGLLVACVVNVVIIVLLVPNYGAMGAAVATLAGNLIAAYINLFAYRKRLKLSMMALMLPRRSDISFLLNVLRVRLGRGVSRS